MQRPDWERRSLDLPGSTDSDERIDLSMGSGILAWMKLVAPHVSRIGAMMSEWWQMVAKRSELGQRSLLELQIPLLCQLGNPQTKQKRGPRAIRLSTQVLGRVRGGCFGGSCQGPTTRKCQADRRRSGALRFSGDGRQVGWYGPVGYRVDATLSKQI